MQNDTPERSRNKQKAHPRREGPLRFWRRIADKTPNSTAAYRTRNRDREPCRTMPGSPRRDDNPHRPTKLSRGTDETEALPHKGTAKREWPLAVCGSFGERDSRKRIPKQNGAAVD